MIEWPSTLRVYLVIGPTDMRKSIDILAILVVEQLDQDPLSGHLFGFVKTNDTANNTLKKKG